MGSMPIANYIEAQQNGVPTTKQNVGALAGVTFLLMIIYVIYSFIKSAPRIVINRDFISFNKQGFSFEEIDRIEFTGKRGSGFWVFLDWDGAALYFKDGTVKYIHDYPYKNISEIKLTLKALVVDRNESFLEKNMPVEKAELSNEVFETYTNSPFISFRILMLPGIATLLYFSKRNHKYDFWVSVIFSIGFAILSLAMMNYFKVSEKYFVVRHYLFFWRVKAYRLNEIIELKFEPGGRAPDRLIITTRDYKTHKYSAASIWGKTWKRLAKRLSSAGIIVQDKGVI